MRVNLFIWVTALLFPIISSCSQGITLHQAVKDNNIKKVKELTKKGADINEFSDEDIQSPLQVAAYIGSVEMCKTLLEAGADPTLRDEGWNTAIDIAMQEGKWDFAHICIEHAIKGFIEKRAISKDKFLYVRIPFFHILIPGFSAGEEEPAEGYKGLETTYFSG